MNPTDQQRIEDIVQIILEYTLKDFSKKIAISPEGDDLDAISAGINALGEELGLRIDELEVINSEISNSRDFLDTVLENIPNMIFVKDAKDLRFVMFNTAGEKLLGYSRKDLIGKNDYDFFPKAEADAFTLRDKEVLRLGEILDVAEEPIHTNHLGVRWLHTKKIPIYDANGKPKYLLGISEDITELKANRLNIDQQILTLNSAGLMSKTDAAGRITYVNDKFCDAFKYSREELIGKNHRILKSGEQPDSLFQEMWKTISAGNIWRGDICNREKDGGLCWHSTTIVPHRALDGTISKYVSISFEITEVVNQKIKLIKQAEELQSQHEELRQANEELEEHSQKLKEQQEELQANNEELEEQTQVIEQKNQDLESAHTNIELKARQLEVSSKYKSEFLANMSHELRTPLNSLLILSSDLAQNKTGNLTEEQVESAEVISKSGKDLLNLINEILDLSKIEAGKMELNLREMEIRTFALDVVRDFRRIAEEKGLKIATAIDALLPESITTDRQRLGQVVKNLMSNAIKFTEAGTVTLAFNMESGGNLALSVTDTGIGIPTDKHDLVFEAFQQADGGTSRKYGGTGLGLSISRELAKMLGGHITIQSQVGKGSVFTLIIPLKTGVAEQIPKPRKKQTVRHDTVLPDVQFVNFPTIEDQREHLTENDRVILIIEDDRNFARLLGKQAREKGFKFLSAATGEDGLLMAAKYNPDAVILDLDLPGISGNTVLVELKNDPNLRHIPVHIMSVYEKSLEPIRSGAVEYLTKPVSKEQLDDAFRRIEDLVSRKMKNLLLVEDDDVLRKAMVKLIGNGDVKCYEARTAKEALTQIKKQPIDCVVLDIGLPDISGFQLIREFEKLLQGKVPPIVVYTGKELSKQENDELQEYAETIIIKGAKSEERLLDETALFLHRTVRNLPQNVQEIIGVLYDKETMFAGKKVLLVDDDMRNIFALGKVLKEKGLVITKAENGQVALDALQKDPGIDLVLMDIMMPVMDGYDCMKEIRRHKKFQTLPIIALTAKAMKEDRQKCIAAGASDYITKPVDVDRLLSLMSVWINK